jgi:hypothetical protein
MANSWNKQPVWQGTGSSYLNSVNDATIGGQITTVPNAYASEGNQTLPGDHVVYDEAAANAAGNPALPQLHGGYFQYVQLDPTIATVGALSGLITITAAGTGYTTATTSVSFAAAPAGGTTATGFAVISPTGTVAQIVVTNQGAGYTAAPAITITSTGGGTGATATSAIQAVSAIVGGQAMFWKNVGSTSGIYTVTNIESGNIPLFAGGLLNPNWTPGNYSWIQCLGRANLLTSGLIAAGAGVQLAAAGAGASNATFITGSGAAAATLVPYFVGVSEAPIASGSTGIVDIQKVTLRF